MLPLSLKATPEYLLRLTLLETKPPALICGRRAAFLGIKNAHRKGEAVGDSRLRSSATCSPWRTTRNCCGRRCCRATAARARGPTGAGRTRPSTRAAGAFPAAAGRRSPLSAGTFPRQSPVAPCMIPGTVYEPQPQRQNFTPLSFDLNGAIAAFLGIYLHLSPCYLPSDNDGSTGL